ncbi:MULTISPECIES: Dyp-type peroxidase [Acinetobacter]|jgi:putative iron-dependent peroxidase|uniref:Dyp-type peroxidase n=1 Tax=Acinetobacter guillouiae TaxID=106649 RepID=A0A8X8GI31_ACIGI|nr:MULTISPECIES: Dyp-type peroxidase [Acinetobacter]MCF0266627.1 Dyp-type peroxidase [Acinetobacter guillouiae]MCS4300194.1 putative iron-dependent peroxidase [Acinetobacter guillouiae]MCW2253534.1 putative iron-dependent peroxidase [Acinetobacter sp. BIGb0204]NII37672.1 putative iron-dependent peroxidase [Acinetobacter sp. BIGb0196]
MTAQSVILPLPSNHARFIVLNLKNLSIDGLKEQLNALLNTRDRLITQHPDAEIKTSIAFGPELWAKLYHTTPEGFKQLEPIQGAFEMPVVPADVLIHIASARTDICFALSQSFFDGIQNQVEVLDERVCFRYLDGRDLTGFIDGTENPQFPDDRAETALLGEDSGIFEDGSFIFAQRYVHELEKWKRLKVDAQENVIGRSKLESIEMDDEHKPENAHIARVVIEDNEGEELEILRHSLPYGDGQGEQGLFFIAYTKDLTRIDRMLVNMFGTQGDGIHDRLLHFVTPIDGAYFFAPNEEVLEEILED